MTEHILDITEQSGTLRTRYEQLVFEQDGETTVSVPLSELATVVVSNNRVRYSHALLAGIAQAGATLVVCDEKHLPAAMLLPLAGHHVQAERFRIQADVKKTTRKRLWQQIVRAKLRAQGTLLQELRGDDLGIGRMVDRVRSGDKDNMEARAARRYWGALFADPDFQRSRDADDQNRHLNYGYAVLRAVVARAICGVGLHPSLGLHHHNRYDAFCLADDLMEPYRPLVDRAVVRWVEHHDPAGPLDQATRKHLIKSLTGRVGLEGEQRTLFDALRRYASSLVKVLEGKRDRLLIPEL